MVLFMCLISCAQIGFFAGIHGHSPSPYFTNAAVPSGDLSVGGSGRTGMTSSKKGNTAARGSTPRHVFPRQRTFVSFAEDRAGELYVLSFSGRIYALNAPAP
jgi:hypothetical protein